MSNLIEVKLEQGSDEWHKLRSQKLGASDTPIIMGVSPWTTPFQLWQRKLGLLPQQQQTSSMKLGNDSEEEARQLFTSMSGIDVMPKVILSDEYDFMMASMDGLSSDNKFGVEIKRANKIDHEMCMDGVVPEKYYPQTQKQALVCKLPMIFYFSFNGKSGKILEVERDEDYIKEIIQEEKKFFDLMSNLESPPLSDRDYEIREDDEWKCLAEEWKLVDSTIKGLEMQKEILRNQFTSFARDKNMKGYGVALSKQIRQGAIDYKQIPEIQNINLDKYRKKPIEYFKISVS